MSYVEKRVLVATYGSLPADSPLLAPVPTASGHAEQRMHVLAARAFVPMADAVRTDLGIELCSASGWRPHRWTSRAEYERVLIAKYGSVEHGRLFLAFDSPHETGLACDFGCGGLEPRSATIAQQQGTPLFRWLVDHAWRYGWTPYMIEPWHWEYSISLTAYRSGVADGEETVICDPSTEICIESLDDLESLK